MTETELRDVLMLRALEREASALSPADPLAQGLSADGAWAGDEARRHPAATGRGPAAEPGHAWLAERARLVLARCRERWGAALPTVPSAAALGLGGGWVWALPLAALLLGWGGDVLAGAQQINLLALPLLGLLAWNGAVYALLAWRGLRAVLAGRAGRSGRPSGPSQPGSPACGPPGPLHRALLWLLWRLQPGAAAGGGPVLSGSVPSGPPATGPVPSGRVPGPAISGSFVQWPRIQAAFAQDWWACTAPLQAQRLGLLVHAAAAALALGVLASLYTRGLVLDYRAGWDSTFLDAADVRRLLAGLLGPASALSGLALPDVPALAALRLARGGGEGAARWIHLWALTLVLVVVLPRLLLAGLAGLRARRLAQRLPLPRERDDLQRLIASASGAPQAVWALPYSYQLDAARSAVLATLAGRRIGPQARLQMAPPLPLGAEDHLPIGLPVGRPAQVLLLMALTATPERESHGAMVAALQAWLAGHCPLQVWVDESGWRERLPGADAAQRLQQRRQAWTRLLAPLGQVPVFVDLGLGTAA